MVLHKFFSLPSPQALRHKFSIRDRAFIQALCEKRDSLPSPQRGAIIKNVSALLTLYEHLSADNFLQAVPDDSGMKQALTQFATATAAHKSKLKAAAGTIPSRYSFKAEDGIEFDMRDLFFNGFVSPATGKPFSATDFDSLQKHPVLGNLIAQFHDMDNMFILPPGNGHQVVDFNTFDLQAFSESRDGIPLGRRQEVYAHLSGLVELSDHVHFENYLPQMADKAPLYMLLRLV